MTNHLADEQSRYLQQHADNPVDWYPWSKAALEKARREDKPIFLSIGYSACHWCHVMAHESFEDEETAALLNEHFVSIKVDREERPDLDRVYMSAVQTLTGRGGWPMSVFITPEGKPFYGGTYFPDEPRHGLPSFKQVLRAVADAWAHRRGELLEGGQQLVGALEQRQSVSDPTAGDLTTKTLDAAYDGLRQQFDAVHGGWGSAPKFPQPMTLAFLLRYHHATEEAQALAMVTQTLDAMARGGIYDQLGGGFHRYAVDDHWLVPHFEKMLYDNALLARVYLHAWQVTGEPLFRAVVEETLDYVLREMTAPQGGFYATQDADTEGEEGKVYLWTPAEIREVLGDEADDFMQPYGVTKAGNFEGKTILTFTGSIEERDALRKARQRLLAARQQRIAPGRDKKVHTAWNGLMLAAFAEAGRVLEREDYLRAAEANAAFLLSELRDAHGRLRHVWIDGKAKVPGFLEDYSHLSEGLLALYQATFEPRWYVAAQALADVMTEHFRADAGFYDTADDAEDLIIRPREVQDNATPSGNAMAATVLLKLARFSGDPVYEELARADLASMQSLMARHPLGFGQWLVALTAALATPTEVVIVGKPAARSTRALLDMAQAGYHPHRLVAVGTGDIPPLLEDRPQIAGKATAYVCRKMTCLQPVTDAEALKELLD
ncbi:MAG: thioredoxin domain-containing protein [Anaerolineae bacterium]